MEVARVRGALRDWGDAFLCWPVAAGADQSLYLHQNRDSFPFQAAWLMSSHLARLAFVETTRGLDSSLLPPP